ncbi:MAG: hypothetical protein AAFQ05_15890, partial [Pseudomonadota bacterium]
LKLNIPRLETERLNLRGTEHKDFEPLCAFLLDPVRSAGFGTEKNRSAAWRWFSGRGERPPAGVFLER